MFSFVGIVGLVFFILVRPQELYPQIAIIPWIYIFFGLAVFGWIIDLRLRLVAPDPAPPLPWAILFFVWCGITAALKSHEPLIDIQMILILFVWYYLISHGIQGIHVLRALGGVLLLLSLYLSLVGAHQHFANNQCVATIEQENGLPAEFGTPDGRPCKKPDDCYGQGSEPGMEYLCEKVGIFNTTSILQRVRYIGVLKDPNDLSLTVAISLPLLFAFVQRRPSWLRILFAVIAGGMTIFCIYVSQSRGGQLVTASVLGVYFVRRFGLRGFLIAAVFGIGLFVTVAGSRGEEASESSSKRIEHMYEGMTMFKYAPLAGVGTNQFVEHHYQTAHNAYVLAAAEQGIFGLLFWLATLYFSLKIPLAIYLRFHQRPEANELCRWAMTLNASLIGLYIGIFFLSFTYHYVLWCYQGMSSALYRSARAYDQTFSLPFRAIDALAIIFLSGATVVGLFVLTRLAAPVY